MTKLNEEQNRLLEELAQFESQLEQLPSDFGLINGMSSRFDYQRGKLRFDSWLLRHTDWILNNIPGSEQDVESLRHQYHDNNCNPSGSGYGTRSQMVNTVFIRPFINRIDSLRQDITAGHFESVYKPTEDKAAETAFGFEGLLHPLIVQSSLALYRDGHLREAVLNSVTAIFDLIRDRSGVAEDGDRLIGQVFSINEPILILSEIESESGKNDQKGFMQIFKGAYQGIRNPKAHTLNHDLNEMKVAQYLVFASMLARRVEEANDA
ncbi:TIGR02391 family protein [uncultured Pseudoteredinibacter sp.]|uniref:TIGR02391 family protein n=1 Tax=uncultured Pseudoteredinibacter sp. TaxID=1641701 RepID=UPI002627B5E7|nr:TIGR02391 family protein [uncultured Pseudoteredinibacter sp.]